jgi:hypothetical protein
MGVSGVRGGGWFREEVGTWGSYMSEWLHCV